MASGGYIIYIPKIGKEIKIATYDEILPALKSIQQQIPGCRLMIFEVDVYLGMRSVEDQISNFCE
jgi:hypothetical protein